MLAALKKYLPKSLKRLFHISFACVGAWRYGFPSREILVIGVTGTSGKSSTIYYLRQLLESAGLRVGTLSTIDFYVAGKEKMNDQKMTMLGRAQIQKYLREMVEANCDVAIVETTSEGFLQARHRFINYDLIMLTNLYPEHIEAHGGFENYKQAKIGIFKYVLEGKKKRVSSLRSKKIQAAFGGYDGEVKKIGFLNGNVHEVGEFLRWPSDSLRLFGVGEVVGKKENIIIKDKDIFAATSVVEEWPIIKFSIQAHEFETRLIGQYNVSNLAGAIAVGRSVGVNWDKLVEAVKNLQNPPGRKEFIGEAEQHGFQVMVDYAFEPVAMEGLYEIVKKIPHKRVIHVFGSTGGGRDTARRQVLGKFIGERADVCIVTDEDPYDDDPKAIIDEVARAVRTTGKKDDINLFLFPDRREAVGRAIAMAKKGDLVLVTGKGSEQAMCVANGQKMPWDDRQVVREFIFNKK